MGNESGVLYVGKTINTPDGAQTALSELEKLEKRIDQKTESMDAAESSRVEAEKIRQENESARLKMKQSGRSRVKLR